MGAHCSNHEVQLIHRSLMFNRLLNYSFGSLFKFILHVFSVFSPLVVCECDSKVSVAVVTTKVATKKGIGMARFLNNENSKMIKGSS